MNKYEINYESYVMIDGYRCFEEFDSNILNSIYFSYLSNYFKYNWQVISSFNIGTTLNDYDKFLPYNLLLSKNKLDAKNEIIDNLKDIMNSLSVYDIFFIDVEKRKDFLTGEYTHLLIKIINEINGEICVLPLFRLNIKALEIIYENDSKEKEWLNLGSFDVNYLRTFIDEINSLTESYFKYMTENQHKNEKFLKELERIREDINKNKTIYKIRFKPNTNNIIQISSDNYFKEFEILEDSYVFLNLFGDALYADYCNFVISDKNTLLSFINHFCHSSIRNIEFEEELIDYYNKGFDKIIIKSCSNLKNISI